MERIEEVKKSIEILKKLKWQLSFFKNLCRNKLYDTIDCIEPEIDAAIFIMEEEIKESEKDLKKGENGFKERREKFELTNEWYKFSSALIKKPFSHKNLISTIDKNKYWMNIKEEKFYD